MTDKEVAFEQTSSVIDQLSNKSGWIFIDESDPKNYATFLVFTILFFWAVFVFWRTLFTKLIRVERFDKLEYGEQAHWLSNWVGNTHHLTVGIWIFHNFYSNECSYFNEDLCFLEVQKKYVYCSIYSLGYLTSDFLIAWFLVKGRDELAFQMYFHHVASIIILACGLLIGYSCPGMMNFGLLMELSTLSLNYRSMLTREE